MAADRSEGICRKVNVTASGEIRTPILRSARIIAALRVYPVLKLLCLFFLKCYRKLNNIQ